MQGIEGMMSRLTNHAIGSAHNIAEAANKIKEVTLNIRKATHDLTEALGQLGQVKTTFINIKPKVLEKEEIDLFKESISKMINEVPSQFYSAIETAKK